MVINDPHRFIFVHIPKTAGTSIMTALEALSGNNRRWLARTKHETLADFYAQWPSRRSFVDRLHARSPISYRTFAFVRNPWERMSSLYRYLKESQPRAEIGTVGDFADFLAQAADGVAWIRALHSLRPQVDYFTLPDDRGVPMLRLVYLGHFEHLSEDVSDVTRLLGIRIDLGHQNESTNTQRDFRADYTDHTLEIVGRLFGADAAAFGYVPDERAPRRRCSGQIDRPYGSEPASPPYFSISRRTNSV